MQQNDVTAEDERWADTTAIFYVRWHNPEEVEPGKYAYATVLLKNGEEVTFGKAAAAWLYTQLRGVRQ